MSRHAVNFLSYVFIILAPLTLPAEDHTDYIAGPFEEPSEVTENCLMCHQQQAESFMQTVHWTWSSEPMQVPGHSGTVRLGKRNVLNNFCIGLRTNFPRCTSCHAGYGWESQDFDFSDPKHIDCLVCHDNTGTYTKTPTGAGAPDPGVDLVAVAKSVGPTTRQTCGSCHFYGGGGNNVKHGDLEEVLVEPTKELDVHMGGQDFTCTACHMTEGHKIEGSALSVSTHSSQTVACEQCHGTQPHTKYARFLENHVDRIACQTCHIPEFARANPTKMHWDWSTAGEDREVQLDEYGKPTYSKKKGSFTWKKNVIPTYAWYSGKSTHMLVGDKVRLNAMNSITEPIGSKDDPESKIYPFKVHTASQIADAVNKYLLPTHLFDGGYWSHYDWNKSVSTGADAYGLPYSGEYTFVETEMYWKINHMVAPKEDALECSACHSEIKETRLDWEALGYEGDPINKE